MSGRHKVADWWLRLDVWVVQLFPWVYIYAMRMGVAAYAYVFMQACILREHLNIDYILSEGLQQLWKPILICIDL